jgi:menaquinone-dependent protoporphyrinogen oxidase
MGGVRMRCLLVYASSHGTTEKAARLLSDYLNQDVDLIDLRRASAPDVRSYGAVIIGGSIHAGTMHKKVLSFIDRNKLLLMERHLGLFLCCIYEGDKALTQFENAYPEPLRDQSLCSGLFGGEILYGRMNLFMRPIVRRITGMKEDVFRLDTDEIRRFAIAFDARLAAATLQEARQGEGVKGDVF